MQQVGSLSSEGRLVVLAVFGREACLQLFTRPAGDHILFSESTAQSDTHGRDFSSWQEAQRTRWPLMPAVALK